MNTEQYKNIIVEMFQKLDESDCAFMKQIYTIVKKHLEKKGRH